MRLDRQYIRTQLMAQYITKKVSADKGRSMSAEVLEKAYRRFETLKRQTGVNY
ncbi:hypothetical protein [Bacillus halotolerans]|uniref:hypothetical protein n=1 Tax=Bacillus halotolerans TaxID=260554 RepID=UPI002DB841AE|nr:hypothetical protein [Bacillus halotolerans]MEC0250957.1 hypothetical protein [Bacillus halotolerans]MEC0356728.1 hypothetical protein [Bacillus halotolerans]